MKKDHSVLDFVRLSVAQKVEFGRNVIVKVKASPKFATPDVSIEELEAKNTLLETRSVAAMSGGKEATALMHQTEDEWVDLMRKMARYVDRIADGDSAVILSAGFDLAKQPAPVERPEFSAEHGERSGSVLLRHIAVAGARSYIWQYYKGEVPEATSEWTTAEITTKASAELEGLVPLSKYWFRSAVVTVAGTSEYCKPLMLIVM